jgi:hypothetical protein
MTVNDGVRRANSGVTNLPQRAAVQAIRCPVTVWGTVISRTMNPGSPVLRKERRVLWEKKLCPRSLDAANEAA